MEQKIRVAFILSLKSSWLGGVNYFKTLIDAIKVHQKEYIEPVLFVSIDSERDLINSFDGVEIIYYNYPPKFSVQGLYNRVLNFIFGYSLFYERLLEEYNIDILSHVTGYTFVRNIPSIAWIADFQYKYLPELFSKKDIFIRNYLFEKQAQICDSVILSSNDAQKDFNLFFTKYANKTEILQFVVPYKREAYYSIDELNERYNIGDAFFYLPNQFWVHKNHRIVIDALAKIMDKSIKVICTGSVEDYRNPEYFNDLLKYIEDKNLKNLFLILGKVPYKVVQSLYIHSIGIINPSLFEGWSTTVEEAKTLNKNIILSDIPVHREQGPEKGFFFSPDDSTTLANLLVTLWDKKEEVVDEKELIEKSNNRVKNFAEQYKKIVCKTMAKRVYNKWINLK